MPPHYATAVPAKVARAAVADEIAVLPSERRYQQRARILAGGQESSRRSGPAMARSLADASSTACPRWPSRSFGRERLRGPKPVFRPMQPRSWPTRGKGLASSDRMGTNELIGVRHVCASGRRIPVLLFQNEGGSFAGHCLIADDDTAIIDGPSPEAVVALFERLIDDVLFVRSPDAASAGLCARP
jgi:hypothetical protein